MSDAFISYSRHNQAFVRRLHDALERRKRDTWVDWEGIPPTAEWLSEVYGAIDAAAAVILILTPAFAASDICRLEVEHAVRQGKRIVPILLDAVDPKQLPPEVGTINWLPIEGENFEAFVSRLLEVMDTDLDWVKEHTRLTVRATEWGAQQHDDSRLLRGKALEVAEQWLGVAPQKSLPTTAQQLAFIAASRRAANRRQRKLLASVSTALLIALSLAVFAWVQRDAAIAESRRAQSNAFGAQAVLAQDNAHDPTRAFQYAAAAWELNPANLTAVEIMRRSHYGAGTYPYRGKQYRPPMYREIAHRGTFIDATLMPDGQHLLLDSLDKDTQAQTTELVDLAGQTLATVAGVLSAFSEDGKLFATIDYAGDKPKVFVWDRQGKQILSDDELGRGPGGQHGIFTIENGALKLLPEDKHLAAQRAALLKRINPLTFVEGDPGIPIAVTSSRDGRRIAAYDRDRRFGIWDISGKFVASIPDIAELVVSADFSPDGNYLAMAHANGDLSVWSLKAEDAALSAQANRLVVLHGHTDAARSVVFTPDGRQLISASRDQTIRLWDLESLPVPSIAQSPHTSENVTFHPSRGLIAAHSYSAINVVDMDGTKRLSVAGYFARGVVNSVAMGADAGIYAAASERQLRVITLGDEGFAATTRTVDAHERSILSVSFSLSGKHVVAADSERVTVHDRIGKLVARVPMKIRTSGAYQNEGRPVLVDTVKPEYLLMQSGGSVRFFNLEGKEIGAVRGKLGAGRTDSESFSADGHHALVTKGAHPLAVLNLSTREIVAQTDVPPAGESFLVARFAPASALVYAAIEYRGSCYLWNWKTGAIRDPTLSPYQLESVQVLPSHKRILSKAVDGLRLHDLDGHTLLFLEAPAVRWARMSVDGDYLAVQNTKDEGWPVDIWSFSPRLLQEQTRQAGIRPLEE